MNDFEKIISEKTPTLVDFFATWCGPCKMQMPILDEVKSAVGDSAKIVKVDINANRELAQMYRVQSVPTLMIFKEGKVVWREAGLHRAAQLIDAIKEYS